MNVFKLVGSIFLKDEASKPLEDMEGKLGKTESKFKKFGENVNKFGEKMSSFGKTMTTRVTAPIVGLGTFATKSAIDFESAFAGVRKTVDATEEQFAALEKGIRDMSKELPASAAEIAGVAEAAGQLGIETDNILGFTRVMIDLGEATNLSSEEAATALSRFANIVGMSQKDFDRLGSTIVALGNNFATTEAEIVAMGMRLAGVGAQIGLTESDIMALATAMSSVGIEAEAGGTAMTTVLKRMQNAVSDGGESLDKFAKAAGMSSKEFAKTFESEPIVALDAFIKGLAKSSEEGANLNNILSDLGIKGIRESDTILRLTGATDLLAEAVGLSSEAWEENTALSNEAEQRYATTASQLQIFKNSISDLAIEIGNILIPILMQVVEAVSPWIGRFKELDESTKKFILVIAGIAAAIGPVLIAVGSLISAVSKIVGAFKFIAPAAKAVGVAIGGISWPVVAVIAAIAALIAIGVALWKNWDKVKEVAGNVFGWIKDFIVNAFEAITEAIKGALDWISENVGGIFGDIAEVVKEYMEMAIENLKLAWDFIKETFGNALDFIKALVTGDFEEMKEAISNQMENIKEFLSNIWENIKEFFDGKLSDILGNLKDKFHEMFVSIAEKLGLSEEFIGQVWEYIEGYFKNALDFLKALVSGDFEGMKEAISKQMENAKQLLSNIWNEIKRQVSEKVKEVLGNVRDKFTEIKERIITPIREARDKVREFINKIKEFFTKGSQETSNTVLNKFNEIKDRILTPIKRARDEIKDIVDKIKGFFKNMKLKIPEIGLPRLPKLKITGGFNLSSFPPKVPKISWNAEGGIFDKPTIFNTDKGLQGVGEAGAEAIIPIDKLRTWIGEWMSVYSSSDGDVVNAIDRIGGIIKDAVNTPIRTQGESVENVITINITGDWTVDSDERQRSVAEALANEMERYFRSRGEK